jgi:hypothetical protein
MLRSLISRRLGVLGLAVAGCVAAPSVVKAVAPVNTTQNVFTLTSGNSKTIFNTQSQAGQSQWFVDGTDQLGCMPNGEQWFWYSIGNGAPQSIDTLTNFYNNQAAPNLLTSEYAGAGFDLTLKATLTGGTAGTGNSALSETVSIDNISGAPLQLHFYQFANLMVDDKETNSLTLSGTPINTATQIDPMGTGKAEVSVTGAPNEYQIDNNGAIKLALDNGTNPVTLNDNSVGPISGDDAFAFEWDPTIAAGNTFQVSINKSITNGTVAVPLPKAGYSALAMLVGLASLSFLRRRVKLARA